MIKNTEVLSMLEVTKYIKKEKDSETDIIGFIKKFSKLNLKESKELKGKIEKLDLIKVNEKQIIKIIDLVPENNEELNKIFVEASLNEDETQKIINTIKESK